MAKYDIFISYSRQDADIVKKVSEGLMSAGFSVWIDKNGIESGDAFKSVIVKAIESCNTVVFFSSHSSNESYWTTKEISVAIYDGKNIIPIKLDDSKYNSEIKFDLINLDYIDMSDPSLVDEGIQKLIRSLKNRQLPTAQAEKTANADIQNENKEKPKASLKFLFQYDGCLISLTICLIGIIIVPFLFISHKLLSEPQMPSYSTQEDLLAESPYSFSKDGFLLDVDYDYGDYTYAIAYDTIAADMENPQDIDYPELEEPEYIKLMEEGVEHVRKSRYNEAYIQFLKAANMDFADAMYNVAVSHLTGLGADVDTIAAIQWLQKAAEFDNEPARIKLESLKQPL